MSGTRLISETHDSWVPLTDELSRQLQLPRIVIALKSITPGGQCAQRGLAPLRRPNVHDGREAAAEHGGEIDDTPPQLRRQPWGPLVAPIIDPSRLGPSVGTVRIEDRDAVPI